VVVAIDGPGGVGKSTVARHVAAARHLDYLDTGATYRAAALAAIRGGADLDDPDEVVAAVRLAEIEYESGRVLLDGEDVSSAIRTPQVTAASSRIAAIPEVRLIVVAMQRAWVELRHGRAVVEGRDIGTVVFPEAEVKVFLTARPQVRAARRASDRETVSTADVAEVRAALDERDRADSTRAASPLRPADDANVIDTSDMALAAVTSSVLQMVDRAANRPRLG